MIALVPTNKDAEINKNNFKKLKYELLETEAVKKTTPAIIT
jgi:hypothetical protein